MEGLSSEVGLKIRDAIKAKLVELGCYVDDELPDYIMVMVANKKSCDQMNKDLNLFLSDKTSTFVSWLHNVLERLKKVTQANSKNNSNTGSKKKGRKEERSSKERKRESGSKTRKVSKKTHNTSSRSSKRNRRSNSQRRRHSSSSSSSSLSDNGDDNKRKRPEEEQLKASTSRGDYDPEQLLRKSLVDEASKSKTRTSDRRTSANATKGTETQSKGSRDESKKREELESIRSRRSTLSQAMREGNHRQMKEIMDDSSPSGKRKRDGNQSRSLRNDSNIERKDESQRLRGESEINDREERRYKPGIESRGDSDRFQKKAERPGSKAFTSARSNHGSHDKRNPVREPRNSERRRSDTGYLIESRREYREESNRGASTRSSEHPDTKHGNTDFSGSNEDLRETLRKHKLASSFSIKSKEGTVNTSTSNDMRVEKGSILEHEMRTLQTLRVEVTNDLYDNSQPRIDEDEELEMMRQRALETMKPKQINADATNARNHRFESDVDNPSTKLIIPLNDSSSDEDDMGTKGEETTRFIVTLDGVDKGYFKRLQSKTEEELKPEGSGETINNKCVNSRNETCTTPLKMTSKATRPEAKVAPTVKKPTNNLALNANTTSANNEYKEKDVQSASGVSVKKDVSTSKLVTLKRATSANENKGQNVTKDKVDVVVKPKRARITAPETDSQMTSVNYIHRKIVTDPPRSTTRPLCKYWPQCKRGSNCLFAHPKKPHRATTTTQTRYKWTAASV